ncbi:MAG: acyl-CoA thioesterase, partial [Christensenellaceae bacterium]|nr:acyl-CoA thioesterase [Christensenellaceae bacterium]
TVSYSRTESVHIVMPSNINGTDSLFGGQLMEWIDIIAAVVARRHSGCQVTTAAVDNLVFKSPAFKNDTILLIGKMCYVGNTSMDVRVETYVEKIDGTKTLINTAYLTLVALDENGKPTKVPRLILENENDRTEYDKAILRRSSCKFKPKY